MHLRWGVGWIVASTFDALSVGLRDAEIVPANAGTFPDKASCTQSGELVKCGEDEQTALRDCTGSSDGKKVESLPSAWSFGEDEIRCTLYHDAKLVRIGSAEDS
jgi:hypothetical protein